MPKGEYLQYGGQAIVEGVMMRSPRFFSVACRAPNGKIILRTEAIEKTWIGRQKWLKAPFLRGSLALLDSMALGVRAMRFASNVQMLPEYQVVSEPTPNDETAAAPPSGRVQDVAIGATLVISLVLGLLLFNYLPNTIAERLHLWLKTTDPRLTNFIAELVKAVLFFGYIGLIGLLPDIREVFKYHGAEHKAINTLEADQLLEMEQCLKQTRLHPRCGTSFAIIVLLLGFLVFTFLPRYPLGENHFWLFNVSVRFLIELCILPIIAGVAYELLRLAGKFRNTTVITVLFSPGLGSQYLTTREPEGRHVEVALAALQSCIAAETGAQEPVEYLELDTEESAAKLMAG
ncbi:MAG TPA: DUF1385 domain-containing protein [Fimbriimonas sp.]|nr:DUF1385 domain-containing protein [Fimbriimonas sp.]